MPQPDAAVYSLSWPTEIHPLDAAATGHTHLVRCDGRQFAVTGTAARLLEVLGEGEGTLDALTARLRARGVAGASADQVEKLIAPLRAKGIVHDGLPAVAAGPERRHAAIRLRATVLRPESVRTLVALLAQLFRTPVAIVALVAVVAAHAWFYARVFPSFHWALGTLPAPYYLLLMLLTTVTTLVHELGHAAACRRFGCAHGPIGWGVYLFTPVFYTDVSEVWRLPRRQRAVVDVGGVYLESLAAAAVLAGFLLTGHPLLVYAFLLIDVSCLSQLTPILRRDGYWMVADLSGHTNLREKSADLVRRILTGRRGGAPAATRAQAFIVAYTVVSAVLTCALFAWLGVRVAVEVAPALPRLFGALVAGPHDPASVAAAGLRLVLNLLFLVLVAASAVRFLRAAGPWLRGDTGAKGAAS